MRGSFKLPEHILVCTVLQASNVPSNMNVGNVHCVEKLATRRLLNKRALNWGEGAGVAELLYAMTNRLGNWGDVTAGINSKEANIKISKDQN